MADKKITDLPAATAVADTDLFEICKDPSGTPTSEKLSVTQLFGIGAMTCNGTASAIDLDNSGTLVGDVAILSDDSIGFYIQGSAVFQCNVAGTRFRDFTGFEVILIDDGNKLGFFDGTTPAAQVNETDKTAGALYTANEQDMINQMWSLLKSYGLLKTV